MKRVAPAAEPRFVDERSSHIDQMPIFVTGTTLRMMLKNYETKAVTSLDTDPVSTKPDGPMPFNTTINE